MKKFELRLKHGEKNETIGVYNDMKEVTDGFINYGKSRGILYECDTRDNILDAFESRGFYVIGYGPMIASLKEVEN